MVEEKTERRIIITRSDERVVGEVIKEITKDIQRRKVDGCDYSRLVSKDPKEFKCWNHEVLHKVYDTGELVSGRKEKGKYKTNFFRFEGDIVFLNMSDRLGMDDAYTATIKIKDPLLCESCLCYTNMNERV